jgi:16S rRNA (guanine527-N7)-methyltransferase
MTASRIRDLLRPFELDLTRHQAEQLLAYLELLMKWNRKVNLTSVRSEEECVTRHFGESLYLARWVDLSGRLLDVGSGAGFPGLALKIVFPEMRATLLEPVAKKRAFLKEVARVCGIAGVEVRGDRLEELSGVGVDGGFDCGTARAVGDPEVMTEGLAKVLKPGGTAYLWITRGQGERLEGEKFGLMGREPIRVPLSRERIIWSGVRR